MPDQPAQLLTVAEVARHLRCSPRTVTDRIAAGLIKAVRPVAACGRRTARWLIPQASLDAYLGVCVAVTPQPDPDPPAHLMEADRLEAEAMIDDMQRQRSRRPGSRRKPRLSGETYG